MSYYKSFSSLSLFFGGEKTFRGCSHAINSSFVRITTTNWSLKYIDIVFIVLKKNISYFSRLNNSEYAVDSVVSSKSLYIGLRFTDRGSVRFSWNLKYGWIYV